MKKILLVLSSFVISLVICEITLTIFIPVTTLKFYQNDTIGRMLVPNQDEMFVTPSNEYYANVKVNSKGWSDVEHNFNKSEGVFRILILGDSFVENWQVPFEERFFRQIQKMLGDKYEIIALGLGNIGTYHQHLVLKNYGLEYKPDLVIQMFLTANDIKNNSPILHPSLYQNKKENWFKEKIKTLRTVKLFLAFRQKLIENKQNKLVDYPIDYHVYDQTFSSNYQKAWEDTKNLILESKKLTEESGAKYMLVTLANNEQVNKKVLDEIYHEYPKAKNANLDLEKPDKLIKEFADLEKINLFQMLPYYLDFIKNNPNTPTHFFNDGHWNKIGTDLAAKLLFDQIISQN